MAYDYTQKVENISAFQWTGAVPDDVPAWFNTMNTVSGPIYYPIIGGSLGVDMNITDRVTGVILPPIIVQVTNWVVKHDDDSLEVVSDTDFNKRYVPTP